ncbi:pyridoxal phosphate-dependent aminotransferase family protein [Helicobacter sp. MIT 14-3879]|uniref:aminotransferase class I/II-fold pyridoxal phosphate-dependent enzyme n=1 Tax=Helicobacter sp. MIT 14-3879 TaxID=2040649 RepID=UPI000E1E9D3D|nr:pyridoxal phosphate-dependent aminotransferase family protein [Helicobacter sp. MIT 14-3879]RDU64676.1 8-amino-7-oxononanoate synthase [Helicobacter sp. MIT 14-3879]
MFYKQELDLLNKNKTLRVRRIFSNSYLDFASNDYLGLSYNKTSIKKAYKLVVNKKLNSPRASMLINGYSILHKKLESTLSKINNFQSCILLGSGFLANIALFETLVRKKDILFIDEEYHASGILATKLIKNVCFFKHNDCRDLETKIKQYSKDIKYNRILIAIEGIYSMSGDIAKKEFTKIAIKYNAILIVDEAHSSGTLGDNLLGYFDFYNIDIKPNFIKMGTLSKAYGSYGAYILSSKHINDYLQSRAKPIIYSTALSAFDTALALVNIKYIQKNKKHFNNKLKIIKKIILKNIQIKLDSQIFSIKFHNQEEMIKKANFLKKHNFLVGAIRKPTVNMPTLRVILSLKHNKKDIYNLCNLLKK